MVFPVRNLNSILPRAFRMRIMLTPQCAEAIVVRPQNRRGGVLTVLFR